MYKKLLVKALGIFFIFPAAYSQTVSQTTTYANDALRFSQFQPTGTARFMGMGGVNQALGGDLSSLSGNPAGLGLYNKSEFGLTLGLGFASTSSNFMSSSTTKDNRGYLTIPNFGVVFSSDKTKKRSSAYKGGSFGIGYTRISNFQNKYSYSGINTKSALTDNMLESANSPENGFTDSYYEHLDPSQDLLYLDELGYYAYLINPQTIVKDGNGNPIYDSYGDLQGNNFKAWNTNQDNNQSETVTTKGAIRQWNFTYGGNFNDKFFIGASIGIPTLRYETNRYFKEGPKNTTNPLNYYTTGETYKATGTGINAKFGISAKPNDWLRLGVSVQTPTYFSVSENTQTNITAVYRAASFTDIYGQSNPLTNIGTYNTAPLVYKYNLITPLRVGGGLAFFFNKLGFIAADVEAVPYGTMNLREATEYQTPGGSSFNDDNTNISNAFKTVINFNVGGELRHDIYRFRLGYSKQGDPYNLIGNNVDRSTTNISGGFGIKIENYYLDFALVNSRYNTTYYPYTVQNKESPLVNIKNVNTSVLVSGGVYF